MVTYSLNERTSSTHIPTPKGGLVFGLIIGVILLAFSALIAHSHKLVGLQARIFYDIDNIDLPNSFTTAAKVITEGLGAAYPIAACAIISAAFKKFRLAWRFVLTAGGAFALAYVVKEIVKEPRPIAMLHGHLQQRVVETGPGFPSGHEAAATALALTLWFVLPVKWRFISILWIVVVAASRLYLGVHTPMDIVGGFACGLLAVTVVRLLPKSIAVLLQLEPADPSDKLNLT
jgi:membrane-associated phospholipid phosphatase